MFCSASLCPAPSRLTTRRYVYPNLRLRQLASFLPSGDLSWHAHPRSRTLSTAITTRRAHSPAGYP